MEVSKVRRGLYVGWILLHQGWGRWGLSALPWCSWSFLPWCRGGSHVAIYGWTLMSSRGPNSDTSFLHMKDGEGASPSSQTWASAPWEWGRGGVEVPTHIWCNQGLNTPVFQGLKLRHLPHMRDGVAAKRRSGFERAPTRAPVFGHLCIYTWAMNLPWFPQSVVEFKFNRE